MKKESAVLITTSNVSLDSADVVVDYAQLLNTREHVKDNAGLMAIKLLMDCGVKKIYLAGFDGYSRDFSENYTQGNDSVIYKNSIVDNLNSGMNEMLAKYAKQVDIEFLTTPRFLYI